MQDRNKFLDNEFSFSKAKKNPYVKNLKDQATTNFNDKNKVDAIRKRKKSIREN